MPILNIEQQIPFGGGYSSRLNNRIGAVRWRLSAEDEFAGDRFRVTAQLLDAKSNRVLGRHAVVMLHVWDGTGAFNGTLESDAAIVNTIVAGTKIHELIDDKVWLVLTDGTGKVAVDITDADLDSFYLGLSAGDFFSISPKIVFTTPAPPPP
jgi:hypothetical protein